MMAFVRQVDHKTTNGCLLRFQKTLTVVSNGTSIKRSDYQWSAKSRLACVLGRLDAAISVF